MIKKRNFRLVVFSLLGAGLVCMVIGAKQEEGTAKKILLGLTGFFYVAAAVQILIYRSKPKLFEDKKQTNI